MLQTIANGVYCLTVSSARGAAAVHAAHGGRAEPEARAETVRAVFCMADRALAEDSRNDPRGSVGARVAAPGPPGLPRSTSV